MASSPAPPITRPEGEPSKVTEVSIRWFGSVALLTLAGPHANALSLDLIDKLRAALADAAGQARAIVLTAAGSAFCAGAALDPSLDPTRADYDAGAALDSHFHPLIRDVHALPVPFVTAINGVAAGGAIGLALAGDLVVASERASFVPAFSRIALTPDCGVTQLLVAGMGRVRAMEWLMLGDAMTAAQAAEWKLVNRVVAPEMLTEVALELAQRLAAGPTRTFALTRQLGWTAMGVTATEALAAERAAQRRAGRHADHREGLAAFRERRAPVFSGA